MHSTTTTSSSDALAFGWQSFIVGFDSTRQIELLKGWFGEIKVSWFVALLLGSWLAVSLPVMLWLNRQRSVSLMVREKQRFSAVCRRLEQRGCSRALGEAPLQTLRRARDHLPEADPLYLALEVAIADLYRR